ncbi:MAG: DUF192 domain-containing protein [Alphaproteobacteria bacterium]|nr:DUF192 domain-containing protein [Alphaproteobacteria bacterium]
MRQRYGFGVLGLLAALLTAAFAGDMVFGRAEVRIGTAAGVRLFHVELAETPEQRARGLMFRRTLAPDAGMLFLFPERERPTMWMANTWLPLDMLFIAADGRIVHLFPNAVPRSRLTISSPHPARMVLELGGGTARRLGIAPGDRLSWRRVDR